MPLPLRNAVNSLTEKYSGYCGIFAGDDANGYRFIVGSSSCNCQELATRMRQEFQAKGGGSAPMIQGNVGATAEALRKMWGDLVVPANHSTALVNCQVPAFLGWNASDLFFP